MENNKVDNVSPEAGKGKVEGFSAETQRKKFLSGVLSRKPEDDRRKNQDKQSFLENLYFRNDVKGGLKRIFGEEAIRSGELPDNFTLPPEIHTRSMEMLEKSDSGEWSQKFYFKDGKWMQGKEYKGTHYHARDYNVDPITKSELKLGVPVIDIHTHPSIKLAEKLLRKINPRKSELEEKELQKDIIELKATEFFPSCFDIDNFVSNQKNKGAIMMVMHDNGSTLMVRNAFLRDLKLGDLFKKDGIESAGIGDLFNKSVWRKEGELKRQEEYSAENLAANPDNGYLEKIIKIYLIALSEAGKKGDFTSYYNTEPKSPVFKKINKELLEGMKMKQV